MLSPLAPLRAEEIRETDSWRIFRSEEGRFQVDGPGEPVVETDSRSTFLGAVSETKYTLRFKGALVAVEVHDFPAVATKLVSDRLILEQVRSGVLEDMGATLIESKELLRQESPARDFTYRVPVDPPLIERALAVLVGSRIYIVTGLAARSPHADPEIERFFASFRFWEEGEEPAGD